MVPTDDWRRSVAMADGPVFVSQPVRAITDNRLAK